MSNTFNQLIIELNKKGFSIFSLTKLNAVSVYTADYYENYDYDIVIPSQREKLVKLLSERGFKQTSGRVITNSDKSIIFEFPKPNFTLGDDPASKAEKLINSSQSYVIITPTQALLIYLKRYYDQIKAELDSANSRPIISELLDLLYDQPANLDKVREWLGPSNQTEVFILLKQDFRAQQQAGIVDRRNHTFASRILKRLSQT